MNHMTIVGNLTRDPELRFLASGQAVCNMGLASTRRYQQNGEWKEQTSFFNLTVWGEQGQNCAASMSKGMRIVVSGRLETREYEHDGQKRVGHDVIVDEIGPSLRWATASVEKTASRSSDAGSTPPPAPAERASNDPIYGDEPPF